MSNRVVYFEIQADEPEKVAKFYTDVFGWEIKKWDGPEDYWLITTGPESEKGIDGGLMKRQRPLSGDDGMVGYTCVVEVSSIDEYTEQIVSNSGQVVMPKMAIPGVGWIAYYKDTGENVFGMMQPDEAAK